MSFFLLLAFFYTQAQEDQNCFSDCLGKDWENCIKNCSVPFINAQTMDGDLIDSKKLEGRIIVLNFWGITCAPCVAEFPALNRLVREYKNKTVVFLSVTSDPKEKLAVFLNERKFDFKIIAEAKKIIERFKIVVFPTTFIIDQKGRIVNGSMGGFTDSRAETAAYKRIKPVIDSLLQAHQ